MKQKYTECAAIDIGSQNIFVAILNKDGFKVFGTTTVDFHSASKYLSDENVKQVAMEATGVYWMGLYDVLEQGGFKLSLVKAGDAKQLPGRDKTDGEDCQWLCELFGKGLLRNSLIPQDNIRELRHYMRMREDHIEMAAQHKQHIQKNFLMMNIRLPEAISDITGVTGRRMIESILSGERDPQKLVQLCHGTIELKKRDRIFKSLQGIYKTEYLFGLQQSYQCWQFYQQQIKMCDQMIDNWLNTQLKDQSVVPHKKLKKAAGTNKLNIINIEEKILMLNGGIDVTRLSGISCNNALRLISELGTDLSKWPRDKSFVKYLGLAGLKGDSGKMKKNKKQRMPRAGQIFREAAQTLMRSHKTALGAFARRINARRGPYIAIKATARKLAILYYNIFTKGIDYVEKGSELYTKQLQANEILKLKKLAKKHGLRLETA